jgi:hypothetical protein
VSDVNVIVQNSTGNLMYCWFNTCAGGEPYYKKTGGKWRDPHILRHGESVPIGQYPGLPPQLWLVEVGSEANTDNVKLRFTKCDVKLDMRPDLPAEQWKLVTLRGKSEMKVLDVFPYGGTTPNTTPTVLLQVYKDWSVSVRPTDESEFLGFPLVLNLTIKDIDFKAVSAGITAEYTKAALRAVVLPGNKDKVTVVEGDSTAVPPTDARIKTNAKLDFEFRVLRDGFGEETPEAREYYRPLGFALKQTAHSENGNSGTLDDPAGWDNFGTFRVRENVLTVRDVNPHHQDTDTFKYCILIQRKDGAMGIIDPEIENEPEHQT